VAGPGIFTVGPIRSWDPSRHLEAIAVESCRMYVQRCFYCAIGQTLLIDQKVHVKKTPPGAVPLDPAGDFSSTVPQTTVI